MSRTVRRRLQAVSVALHSSTVFFLFLQRSRETVAPTDAAEFVRFCVRVLVRHGPVASVYIYIYIFIMYISGSA